MSGSRKKPGPRPKKLPPKPKHKKVDPEPEPSDSIFDVEDPYGPPPVEVPPTVEEEPEVVLGVMETWRPPEEVPPEDLPEPVSVAAADPMLGRICQDCGQQARIVSNDMGVQAYCGPCKKDWPIRPPGLVDVPGTMPRSLNKQTIAQPDYGLAWEQFPDDYEP